MLYAFVGTFDDSYRYGLRGNGKTLSMTYYLYQDYLNGKNIFTNYKTTFSEVMTTQEIIEFILSLDDLTNISIAIDEIQKIMNSIGTSAKDVKFIENFISQSRKRKTDIYYATQRFKNVHNRIRVQTDTILQPVKRHYTKINNQIYLGEICVLDNCDMQHIIEVRCEFPHLLKPINYLLCDKVGCLYNTDEIVKEELHQYNPNEIIKKLKSELKYLEPDERQKVIEKLQKLK